MRYVDPDGRILVISSEDDKFINNVNIALDYLAKTPNGKIIVEALKSDTKIYYIVQCYGTINDSFIDNEIYWDPKATVYANNGEYNSPAICLFHELIHAYFTTQKGKKVLDTLLNQILSSQGLTIQDIQSSDIQNLTEEIVTRFEQKAAKELGEPLGRKSYNDIMRYSSYAIDVIVDNPLIYSKNEEKK